jgi:hypothetical protein
MRFTVSSFLLHSQFSNKCEHESLFLGHLVLDQPNNCCENRTSDATTGHLANERADGSRARGLCKHRNYCRKKLASNAATDRTGKTIPNRSEVDIFARCTSNIATDRTRNDLDEQIDQHS